MLRSDHKLVLEMANLVMYELRNHKLQAAAPTLEQLPCTQPAKTHSSGHRPPVRMQQPSSLEKLSRPRTALVQSASLATLNADYLQEALDSLFVPSSSTVDESYDTNRSWPPWPHADPSLRLLPAAVASPTAVDLDTSPTGPTRVLSSSVDESQPTDASKKTLNREYQRKFRMRSKVRN